MTREQAIDAAVVNVFGIPELMRLAAEYRCRKILYGETLSTMNDYGIKLIGAEFSKIWAAQ